jgi:alkylhydroperoxidase family enzyme
VTKEQWNCTAADVQTLRDHGFKDEDILAAVQIMALFNYFTRMADALGVELNEGYAALGAKPGTMVT